MMGFGVAGGLAAHLMGVLVGGICALLIGQSILGRGWPKAERPAGLYGYMVGYMGAFTAYGLLSNADVVLVKHYFPADQAGVFAKAAMVARIVLFLPAPVAAAMFPKVTSSGESSQASRRTLIKALMLVGLMVGLMFYMGLVTLPRVAVIFVVPAASDWARPVPLIVATAGVAEAQVT